jgi:hypothetical protein
MQSHDLKAEISALELKMTEYQGLLDKSFEENEEFGKTKKIFHELKKIKERLDELKERENGN